VKVAPEPAAPSPEATAGRRALRSRLLADRDAFVASAAFAQGHAGLALHLCAALASLEPRCLGLYWAIRSEFNAVAALAADGRWDKVDRALPFARRSPRVLEFRRWDGSPPSAVDECGIATGSGPAVEPDVVVVPCVGFTGDGYRLGYGGGYYDRWLAGRRHVVAVGVAWSLARLDEPAFAAQPHDVPLALVVTEEGVVVG
jgi:5,10-methenyltetrahydrofolate synthetase